ncbi:hypothetical protein JVT61DRAFT_12196 [Boletus reticuloceps]|uniref:DUF8190 domain-containing protein n=1 Tax=Boletus reticuloceps TaxID=495285 RepID=A0A8I2YE72_9AGAM|nr:hypothetical protein JVT61DRAFT_12196 [Boletus reticuloceps]
MSDGEPENIHDDAEENLDAAFDELADDGAHDAPFNATEVPLTLEAVDAPNQQSVEAAIYDHSEEQPVDHAALFHAERVNRVGFGTLRKLWTDGDAKGAMRLLSRRHQLTIERQHRLDVEDPDMSIGAGPHYLDFVMYVGDGLGLDAVLPNIATDHTWRLSLNFSTMQQLWPDGKPTRLPFDTRGRMMYVGRRMEEHVWLSMVPNEWLIPDHPLNATGAWPRLNVPTSAMESKHALMLVMFMAHAFSTLRVRDFSCREHYPEPLTRAKVNSVTDILSRSIDLRLDDVRALDEHFKHQWEDWIEHAPDSWKRDRFLTNNTPVAISMKYGQNQQVVRPDMTTIEARNWKRDRDYAHIKLFRFSIATHVNHMEVLQWEDIPIGALVANNPIAYDSPDEDEVVRQQVDLETLPILDMDGNEITVYGPDGYRIVRRSIADMEEAGGLLDLGKVHTLFEAPPDGLHGDNRQNAVKYTLYPLAFTKRYGNVQADGLVTPFARRMDLLDTQLWEERGPGEDGMDVDEPAIPRLLHAVCCQIYNSLSHRVRDAAKFHEVQRGMLAAALSGCTAPTLPGKNRWRRIVERVREALPHERFAEKVRGDNQPQSMRFENTYQLDVQMLPERKRSGDVIFREVIKPLARIWAHPSVLQPVKCVCVALKKGVVPELFQCATYPLTCLIEKLWKDVEPSLEAGYVVDPCILETMAMLERTLNYGHTGNTRVLTKTLMNQMWLGLSVVQDGLPCIADWFISSAAMSAGMITIQKDRWPVHARTRLPLTASQRCQELTYGKGHYVSYLAAFTIKIAMKHVPNDQYADQEDVILRLACYAADVALRSLVSDVMTLVQTALLEQLTSMINEDGPEAGIARGRKRALIAWLRSKNPLSLDNDTLPYLIEAIVVPLDGEMDLKKSNPATTPLIQFIEDVVTHCKKDRPRRRPPFIADGQFLHVARAAICEVTAFARRHGIKEEDVVNVVHQGFIAACHKLKIHQVPWSIPANGRAGAPSTRVVHDVWMNLCAKNPKGPPMSAAILAHSRMPAALARRASQKIIASAPTGEWTIAEVSLKKFHTVLHKTVLPKELLVHGVEEQRVPDYIRAAFNHARTSYNPENPIHLLAIIASIACAGLLPAIFAHEADLNDNVPSNPSHYTAHLRQLDWVRKPNKNGGKGVNDKELFMRVLMWYIICLYDEESPISQRARARGEDRPAGGNSKWFSKYSSKAKAFKVPVWGQDVHPLQASAIGSLHENVVRRLMSDDKYGGYDAIQFMMGTKTADHLSETGYVSRRATGILPSSNSMASTSALGSASSRGKRENREWEADEDEYVRADTSALQTHRRKASRTY